MHAFVPPRLVRQLGAAGFGAASTGMGIALLLLAPAMFTTLVDGRWSTALIDWVQVACDFLAFAFAWRSWRLCAAPEPCRRALALLAASLLSLALADTGWAWVDAVRGEDPSASAINWLYLPFYPLLLAAVLAFPRALQGRDDQLRFALDAGIVALGVGLLLWHCIAQPNLPALQADSAPLTLYVLVGQPLLDCVAALAAALLLLRLPRGAARRAMLWLAIAIALNLLGNLILAVRAAQDEFSTGGIADVLWIGSRWSLLVAAEAQWRAQRAPLPPADERGWHPSFALLPYLAVIAGYATVLYDALDAGVSIANLAGSIVLTALVLVRQAVDRRQTEGLLADRARRAGESRLAALVEHASEAILVLDAQRQVGYASPAAAHLLGLPPDALRGQPFASFLHPDESLAAATLLAGQLRPGPSRQAMLRLRRAEGWIWTECTLTDLLATPDVGGIVLNVRDVTAQRELEEQLRHQSFHDPLTGLINRLLFGERISEALTERRSDGAAMAVMFVDLDHFKVINDSLGHGSGDAVIGQAALRLEAAVRDRDVLARLGGDEFGVLLQDLRDDGDVVEAARRVMDAFRTPFGIDGREVPLSVSLGIAWAGDNDTVDVLLRNADLALNEAKARGRDRFHVFQPDLHATVLRKLKLHGALRELLDRDGFTLAYQPIVRLDTLAPVGVEALLRWPAQVEMEASTADAVAAAEESGLIVPLGRWVLEQALREMQALRDVHGIEQELRLTVNLSARQLHDAELAPIVAAALLAHGIAPGRLVLELTETAVVERSDETLAALQRLKAIGLRLAIDDFGTGYSSLAHLARYPFDLLKVAKPFVDMIGPEGDPHGARLARAVLALGGSLRLQTIAEGIEHPRQLTVLREAGCDLAQGFLLARPLSLAELVAWLRQTCPPASSPIPATNPVLPGVMR
jgi:diguanylate cyclase (GGDEF)-like protein/PAS domain S-box-containing protein